MYCSFQKVTHRPLALCSWSNRRQKSELDHYYTENIDLINHYISDAIAVDNGEEGRLVATRNEEAIVHQRLIDNRLAKVFYLLYIRVHANEYRIIQ